MPLAREHRRTKHFSWRLHPVAIVSLLALTTGCDHSSPLPAPVAKPKAKEKLEVVTATLRPWPTTVRLQGSLVADEKATVGAKVAGRIESVLVDIGKRVKKTEPLAKIEAKDQELLVAQAEARLFQVRAGLGLGLDDLSKTPNPAIAPPVREAEAVLEEVTLRANRAKSLKGLNAISTEEVEILVAAQHVAEAKHATARNDVDEQIALMRLRQTELDLARQLVADTVITAPFDGIVEAKQSSPGAYVQVGDPVATVVRVDPLRYRAGVPERYASRVQIGLELTIHVENDRAPLRAKVARMSPSLDAASRSLLIEADVPNPQGGLQTWRFAEADMVVGPNDQTLAISESAIDDFAGVQSVWAVVEENKTEQRRVQLGRRQKGWVEILSGLSPGDRILAEARTGRAGLVLDGAAE